MEQITNNIITMGYHFSNGVTGHMITDGNSYQNVTVWNTTENLTVSGKDARCWREESVNTELSRKITYTIVYMLIGLWICSGNALVILAYWKCKKLQTTGNLFLVNLAWADFMVGMIVPYQVSALWLKILSKDPVYCLLRYITMLVPLCASVLSLGLVALDRFIAVVKPMKAASIMTRNRARMLMGVTWFISLIFGIPAPYLSLNRCHGSCDIVNILRWQYFAFCAVPMWAGTGVVVVVIYAYMFWHIHKYEAELRSAFSRAFDQAHSLSREVQIAKLGMLVVGVFYLCWAPLMVMLCIQTFSENGNSPTLIKIRRATFILAFCNSGVNIFIYTIRMPRFRKALKEIFHCRREKQQTTSTSGQGTDSMQLSRESREDTVHDNNNTREIQV